MEVKSKYCKSCEFWKSKEGTAEYDEWYEKHQESCQSNHEGSAGKMEVDSVVEMFKRSEKLHGTKYAYYIGDGDSKTFKGIIDSAPYENLIVKKKVYRSRSEAYGHKNPKFEKKRKDLAAQES